MTETADKLAIIVVGASGHLARTKIYPALFALYCQHHLSETFQIFGFARSDMEDEAFRRSISEHLTCRYAPEEASCALLMDQFLERCHYISGQYDVTEDLVRLRGVIHHDLGGRVNVVAYLAVPPKVFAGVAHAFHGAGFVTTTEGGPWFRAVIEKPFGMDRESSDRLTHAMAGLISEEQIYRIDHYLGKEVIQNLLVLRFANLVFEPIWNRRYIESVHISWSENVGVEGRGGYYDEIGIIRDVMQNHLLQILSLIAMETPAGLDADRIRDEKVKVLRCIPAVVLEDLATGQYVGTRRGGLVIPGYREDPSVPADSLTATYAAVALHIENSRWDGVPFFMCAGKALSGKSTEIRIRFKRVPGRNFADPSHPQDRNELVIRVQPDEAIYLTVLAKVPGMQLALKPTRLDLQYKSAFSELIPDAYESLILDVLEGDKSLFIRDDELAASWDIFTPVLREIEGRRLAPEPYEFGTSGPAGAQALAHRLGIPCGCGSDR